MSYTIQIDERQRQLLIEGLALLLANPDRVPEIDPVWGDDPLQSLHSMLQDESLEPSPTLNGFVL